MSEHTSTQQLRAKPTDQWIRDMQARYPVEPAIDEVMTRKLRNRRKGLEHVSDFSGLHERLTAYLQRATDQPQLSLANLKRLSGGASKEQFTFDLTWKDDSGQRVTRPLILRMDPSESVVETHRLREAQILKAMVGQVPVPEVLWVDPESDALGHPFLIAGFLQGTVMPEGTTKASGVGLMFPEKYRKALGGQFVECMARIHTLDWRTHDLSAFAKPAPGTIEGTRWTVALWERVWQEDTFEAHPVMEYAADWLRRNMPVIDNPVVVHGDYRSGNFMFTPDLKINAILDWELAHLGDHHEDLSWASMTLTGAVADDGTRLASGMIPRDQFFERYRKLTGFEIDPRKIFYFDVFNAWKLGLICMATSLRTAYGKRTHLDVMMNLLTGLGYVCVATVQALLEQDGRERRG
jgi:aminoglycoside phosphotransferase (APT) family kinase protein